MQRFGSSFSDGYDVASPSIPPTLRRYPFLRRSIFSRLLRFGRQRCPVVRVDPEA